MKWVTREKARVDRIACPWLIEKLIDPDATCSSTYPWKTSRRRLGAKGQRRSDVPSPEVPHFERERQRFVSFDALIHADRLTDTALLELAKTVRAADGGSGSVPEAAEPEAAATGFREIAKDDFDNQRLQFPLDDALYAYCRWKVEQGGRRAHTG